MLVKRDFNADMSASTSEADGAEVLGVRGHAAVFDQMTMIGSRDYGFIEEISRDAFKDVLGDDARFLLNHDGIAMARVKNGTLRQSIDEVGLVTDADLNPKMQSARDLHAAIERGDIDQMSFAFTIEDDEVRMLPDDHAQFPGMPMRTIRKIGRLYDHSAVTYPAYEGADIGVRSSATGEGEVSGIHKRASALEVEEIPELEVTDNGVRSTNELDALIARRSISL